MDDADTMQCTVGCEITHPLPPIQGMQDSWKNVSDGERNADQLGEPKAKLLTEEKLVWSDPLLCEYGETMHRPERRWTHLRNSLENDHRVMGCSPGRLNY